MFRFTFEPSSQRQHKLTYIKTVNKSYPVMVSSFYIENLNIGIKIKKSERKRKKKKRKESRKYRIIEYGELIYQIILQL